MSGTWEVYRKDNSRIRSKKYISITKSKTFGLSRPFIDEYNINKNVNAVILFNSKSKSIALKFSEKKPEFGYAIRFGSNPKHGAMIIARKFFEDKGINVDKFAKHYSEYEIVNMSELGFDDIEGKAFVIKLEELDSLTSTTMERDEVAGHTGLSSLI